MFKLNWWVVACATGRFLYAIHILFFEAIELWLYYSQSFSYYFCEHFWTNDEPKIQSTYHFKWNTYEMSLIFALWDMFAEAKFYVIQFHFLNTRWITAHHNVARITFFQMISAHNEHSNDFFFFSPYLARTPMCITFSNFEVNHNVRTSIFQ